MRIRAFRALCPPAALAEKVAAPPYDVVSADEARAQAAGNPMCFFHVSRPEIDLPPGTDPAAPAAYAMAGANLRRFREQGWLAPDTAPGLYLYRLIAGTHTQAGFVVTCHTGDYDAGVIKKHEKTRQKPEDDRTRHIETLKAQTGPVFLAYRDQPELDALAAAAAAGTPRYDFTAPDGVRHTLWRAPDPAAVEGAFARVAAAYIADGHHRAAAAARYAREQRAAGRGGGEADWFLAVLFPASQLRILPYNRLVKDLAGRTPEAFLDEVRRTFRVTEAATPAPAGRHQASMYLGGRWYGLQWDPPGGADPVARLDVSVLQNRLLAPVLGIDDPRQNERIAFVGGIRGTAELQRRVEGGEAAVAFSMFPTSMEDLMAVSDANLLMPPKSTWFEPKLRSGLLIHTLD